MKKICVIHSGGTIGMTKTDKGYAPKKGYLAGLLNNVSFPEGFPEYDLIETDAIYDSSDVSAAQWNEMGGIIFDNYDLYDGFVVLHGTDTMAYTASALSFMLENLTKPVVLTGSQIPLCEARNDARENLFNSMLFASNPHISEVCLCFGGQLFRGNRTTKVSAEEFAAFASPNFPPLAHCGVSINLNKKYLRPSENKRLKFTPFDNFAIAVLKVFPGIQFGVLGNAISHSRELKGMVLEAFGSGTIPTNSGQGLHELLNKAQENGVVTVIVTQCLQGTVSLGLYQASNLLLEKSAICGYDLTVEAAVTKLYYLLSLGLNREDIAREMIKDLRGEITLPDRNEA